MEEKNEKQGFNCYVASGPSCTVSLLFKTSALPEDTDSSSGCFQNPHVS